MTKKIDKVKMPISVSEYTNQNFDCQHISTSNFFDLNVAKAIELVPNQEITINHNVFTRLEPMPVPTFGVASIKTKAFFVPFRTVMPAWNDFIEDVSHVFTDGINHVSNVHLIPNSAFIDFFMNTECSTEVVEPDARFDFKVIRRSGNSAYFTAYKLTPFGRKAYRILRSLGYGINFNYVVSSGAAVPEKYHSAMPLLCLLRVYLDWYFPSVYSQDGDYLGLEAILKHDSQQDWSLLYGNVTTLLKIFKLITRVSYDSDYFVSSWDNPVAPNTGSFMPVNMSDSTSTTDTTIISDGNGTPVLKNAAGISQFMLTALKGLNDYMTRHRLSGARVLDRYLSRWGVVLDSAKLNRSIWFGESTAQLTFGDVTATADTEGAELGSYSGKGIANGNGSFTYETDEFGMLILISTIVPKTSYYQGRERHTQHITKLDFYTPEFDNLGVQALPTSEVYMPMDATKMFPANFGFGNYDNVANFEEEEKVFSFVPRYGEYKRTNDLITGDYILGSQNAGKDSWTLFRNLDHFFAENGMDQRHDIDFIKSVDAEQYNRIFYYTGDGADHFNISHLFNIDVVFPGKKMYDTYEFDTEGKAKNVVMDNGGVKAN